MIEYRPILGFPDYVISNYGTVISMRMGRFKVLKFDVSPKGYRQVNLYREEKTDYGFFVHRLVLETFVGPCPEGMQTRHLDGNPANNWVGNLVWGTAMQNKEDRVRHGKQFKLPTRQGEANNKAVLTEDNVREILISPENGRKLAAKFGVTESAVSGVRKRKTWRHVTLPENS